MALTRVFGATAGRAFMAAAAKSAAKVKASPSGGAAAKPAGKKTAMVRTNTGIQKAVPVSSELGNFVGASEVSRTVAVKKVWEYIKQQNLQGEFGFQLGNPNQLSSSIEQSYKHNPSNKKEVFCDAKLKTIFGGKDKVGFTEIARLLSSHFGKSG